MKENKGLLGNHSWPLSILLHLLPGMLILLSYVYFGMPVAEKMGMPNLVGLMFAGLIALIPFELGLLLFLGYRNTNKWSLEGVVLFRERIPKLKLSFIIFGLVIWAFMVAIGLSFIDEGLRTGLFSWIPESFEEGGFSPMQYGAMAYHVATGLNLILFGLLLPWVEELYFRGFLLPRMPVEGNMAPVLNAILFSLYHFWSPWLTVTRIIFMTPIAWVVWKYKSIQVSIWTHCLLNTLGILLGYILVLLSS